MKHNCAIILFGATGDLSRRKIIPAIYKLIKSGDLEKFCLIGVARDQVSASELLSYSKESIEQFDEKTYETLLQHTVYHALDVTDKDQFQKLRDVVGMCEKKFELSGNRLAYCAIASNLFVPTVEHLVAAGILSCKRNQKGVAGWHRVIFEKPFGKDLATAQEMYKKLCSCLDDNQMYIVDHYLAKEIVANIALLRFTNRIFEPLWSHDNIDSVHIVLRESVDITGREKIYEQFGILHDMVQNHVLQLLALVAMEEPKSLHGDDIRIQKAAVLNNIRFVDGVLGQYNGYRQHPEIAPDSQIPTYAWVHAAIDNNRWQGVPFYLETGKCLQAKETAVYIKFKHVRCLLANCPTKSNVLKISIVPRAGFTIELNAKPVGKTDEVVPVNLEFCHECKYGLYTPSAYEVIFREIMDGSRAISVSYQEIESSWKFIEHIQARNIPLSFYACGSLGPDEEKIKKSHR